MGEYGRQRIENELEWRHEIPKLIAAYETLWNERGASEPADNLIAR